jgi:hypothetical protein
MTTIKKTTGWLSGALAATGLLILVLHLGGINVYHHTDIPFLNNEKHKIVVYKDLQLTYPWIKYTTEIRLDNEIGSPDLYKDITQILSSAGYYDPVNFHLVGTGGRVDAALLLINNIQASKAQVNMIVEAPVYSAHAYIAVSGKTLTMRPYTYMMFHYSSVLNLDCSEATGTDRGVSNKEHCEMYKSTDLYNNNKVVMGLPLLTNQEKFMIMTGHDVYITSDEFYHRVNKGI